MEKFLETVNLLTTYFPTPYYLTLNSAKRKTKRQTSALSGILVFSNILTVRNNSTLSDR